MVVQGSPRVMIGNCYREHALFGPAFHSTLALSKTSFISLISFRERRSLDFYSQSLAFSCFHSQSCRKNPSRNPGPNPNWRITHFHRRRNLSYSSITLNSTTTNQLLGLSSGILRLQKENNNFWIKN